MSLSLQAAKALDAQLPSHAHLFAIPTVASLGIDAANPAPCIYFCGNSLGLMPKAAAPAVAAELAVWQARGVVSHFRRDDPAGDGREPWVSIDRPLAAPLARVLGAEPVEVAVMNTLTGNLHTLLAAFYKPSQTRYKILFEAKAFPSDLYAFQGQARLHGLDPHDALIPLAPRAGEHTLRTADILQAIDDHKDSIAVVLFSAVQYYTGQYFEMEQITRHAHAAAPEIQVGWDLAHAAGNVDLQLHAWGVDFAVFCSYKYLNAGPGGIGGIFVHEKHAKDNRPRLAGWWGNNEQTRFAMHDEFDAIPGAQGFRMSNPSVLNTVCLYESLKVYDAAGGMAALRARSTSLTGFLFDLLRQSRFYVPAADFAAAKEKPIFTVITPEDPKQRGAQLSLLFSDGIMEAVFGQLEQRGIIGDERRPAVIRLAPNPLYNTHVEVYNVAQALDEILSTL